MAPAGGPAGLARKVAAGLLALGVAGVGVGWGAGIAAADPPSFLSEQIVDTADALDAGGRAEVASAQDSLRTESDIQLWVAYVESFDGLSGQDWVDQTAQLSGLGGNDLLFAVALGDRAYGWNASDSLPLSDSEIEQVVAGDVEPQLADSDWAGAAVALAEGVSATATGGGSDGSGSDGSGDAGASGQSDSGGSVLPWVLGAGVVVGGGALVYSAVRRRGGSAGAGGRGGAGAAGGAPGAAAPPTIEELRQDAAAALIEVDDAIKTSEQELGFAIAQFGDEAAAPFAAALATSKQELAKAFHLQRQAQEAEGQPAERGLLEELIGLSRSADARLDEQVAEFDELRDLERTIDTVLPQLGTRAAGLQQRVTASLATAEALTSRWPAAAVAPVTRNLEEAVQRVRFAQESITSGTQMLASDRNAAVARARAAEEALAQAGTLLDDVDRAPQVLDTAQRAIDALIAETERDIGEAERLGLPPEVASNHAFAKETLTWARSAISAGNYDPIETRRALQESDTALENALVPLRAAEESRRRAQALLATATDSARASIQAADDFITTRRGAVGAEARTRLAEAQRQLAEGQAATDPVVALQHMQAADQLADQAHALAQQDEARYRNGQQMGGGGGGGNLGSIILGGILIDAMTRGMGSGGRGGGFPFPSGGSRGGGISFPSGGSRGPGSFGGGGTRGRRSGGGRF